MQPVPSLSVFVATTINLPSLKYLHRSKLKHILIGYSEHGFLCFEDIGAKTTTTENFSLFKHAVVKSVCLHIHQIFSLEIQVSQRPHICERFTFLCLRR